MHCQFCGAALESISAACPFCGSQVVLGGRYEIRAVLGRGGMGEVFRAYDRHLAIEVALKRLAPQLAQNQELRDSLMAEARIMARLSDAAITRLFDLPEFEGGLYMVLEYVCGPSLRDMLKYGYRASVTELAQIMSQICQGLTAAHNAGVIHRDLKPSNLLVALRGPDRDAFLAGRLPANLANGAVKISDFGIAKAIADARATMTNAFSGTPGYMAPEQFRGETPSPETDVYALGVLTHELLTGALPARPMEPIGQAHAAVSQVVQRAMMPLRKDRFPSAAAFYEALYNAIEGRSPIQRPLRPAPRVHPVAVAGLALLGLAAIVVPLATMRTVDVSGRGHAVVPMPVIPPPEQPVAIEWKPLLRTVSPPPVVEAARGPAATGALAGPAHPKVKWSILVDDSLLRMDTVGKDGTLYASSISGQVCAIRDGKVQWAFKTGSMFPLHATLDPDGRVWFSAFDEVYCLNRDGQGGRLPPKSHMPEQIGKSPFTCMKHELWGAQMNRMELDGTCSSDTVAWQPGGLAYVGTDVPEILALRSIGAVAWKSTPVCEPKKLMVTGPNQLVYTCADGRFHGMTGSAATWTHTADGTLYSHYQVDAAGTIYYGDYGKQSTVTHLHALNASGTVTDTLDLKGDAVNDMLLGGQRELFVTGSGRYTRILCLGD